jgi:hypothetical protein
MMLTPPRLVDNRKIMGIWTIEIHALRNPRSSTKWDVETGASTEISKNKVRLV